MQPAVTNVCITWHGRLSAWVIHPMRCREWKRRKQLLTWLHACMHVRMYAVLNQRGRGKFQYVITLLAFMRNYLKRRLFGNFERSRLVRRYTHTRNWVNCGFGRETEIDVWWEIRPGTIICQTPYVHKKLVSQDFWKSTWRPWLHLSIPCTHAICTSYELKSNLNLTLHF